MIRKIFLFITGIILCSYSLMFMTIYLMLIKVGYTFYDYFLFIVSHIEFYYLFIGFLMIHFSLKKNE